jgi:NAD(P)-dependent dehydrogenase (short-subunit alcohol dehydrogenase family)
VAGAYRSTPYPQLHREKSGVDEHSHGYLSQPALGPWRLEYRHFFHLRHWSGPRRFAHYVAAKSAIEGLVRAASWEYEQVQHYIVRPPKLLTDQTNTPLSRQGAISPETVAASLVKTLTTTETSGSLKILEYSSEERN